jgi:Leucine-rich repeat (LRR) protein
MDGLSASPLAKGSKQRKDAGNSSDGEEEGSFVGTTPPTTSPRSHHSNLTDSVNRVDKSPRSHQIGFSPVDQGAMFSRSSSSQVAAGHRSSWWNLNSLLLINNTADRFDAVAMDEDDGFEVPSTRSTWRIRRREKSVLVAALGFLLFVVAAITAIIVQKERESDLSPNNGKTSSSVDDSLHGGNEERYETLLTLLMDQLPNDQLFKSGSPQETALRWLVFEDPVEISPDHPNLLQRYALAVLFFSTSGEMDIQGNITSRWFSAENWMTEIGHCEFAGIECERNVDKDVEYDSDGKITSIYLENNGLEGTIPSELQALTELWRLKLSQNKLKGTIAPSIFQLPKLSDVSIRDNNLTGIIPSTNGKLEQLHLGVNNLTGAIPNTIAYELGLQGLTLERNKLTGTSPGLTELTSLEWLYLQSNFLNGTLPQLGGSYTSIKDLRLGKNSFSGTIPGSWLDFNNLEILYLDGNQGLEGNISGLLLELSHLEELQINATQLQGTIPCEKRGKDVLFSVDCTAVYCTCCAGC